MSALGAILVGAGIGLAIVAAMSVGGFAYDHYVNNDFVHPNTIPVEDMAYLRMGIPPPEKRGIIIDYKPGKDPTLPPPGPSPDSPKPPTSTERQLSEVDQPVVIDPPYTEEERLRNLQPIRMGEMTPEEDEEEIVLKHEPIFAPDSVMGSTGDPLVFNMEQKQ